MFSFSLLYVTSGLSIAILLFYKSHVTGKSLPPGPRPLPLLGNLHQIPKHNPAILYSEWHKKYGDVIYMHIFGREFIILNSLEAIVDLFDKRSVKYSTRPHLVMSNDLVGRPRISILFNKYGPMLRDCRKLVRSWINPRTLSEIYPVQEEASYRLLGNLLESPENFSEHARLYSASVILKLTYGLETQSTNDPFITMSEEFSDITAKSSEPGRWLVDSFPILKHVPVWFPGAYFRKWGVHARETSFKLAKVPYDLVKSQVANGTMKKSWVSEQLLHNSSDAVSEEVLLCSASSMYVGAIDTSVALIRTFVLMMLHHPNVQKKAQQEIDTNVGVDRLPDLQDINSLPYIQYVIKEVLRINPIVPLVPHSLEEDDIYRDWRVPKGTWVMANLRAVFYDSDTYKNPEEFRPERFDPTIQLPERDPTETAFGFGRRFCPGFDLAMSSIFMNVARILATFDISPVTGEDETAQMPAIAYDVGHLSIPKPFTCNFTARNEVRVSLIQTFLTGLSNSN